MTVSIPLHLPKIEDFLNCPKHGHRIGTPKDGTCDLCQTVCEGCGGPIEFPHCDMNSGTKYVYEDPHKDCGRALGSYWIKRPV